MHKVHTPIGGRKDGQTDGRNDGKPKTMSLRFSSKRRGTINALKNCHFTLCQKALSENVKPLTSLPSQYHVFLYMSSKLLVDPVVTSLIYHFTYYILNFCGHQRQHFVNIRIKCPLNVHPYTPLLYSKTGICRGIPIFLIFAPKH